MKNSCHFVASILRACLNISTLPKCAAKTEEANMKLWMSAEVWHEVGDDLGRVDRLAVRLINEELDLRKVHIDNVEEWSVITILLQDDFYPEIKRFHRKRKDMEFRLKIDYESFYDADDIGKLRLVFSMLLRSVELMAEYKIPKDKINILREVCQAAEEKAKAIMLTACPERKGANLRLRMSDRSWEGDILRLEKMVAYLVKDELDLREAQIDNVEEWVVNTALLSEWVVRNNVLLPVCYEAIKKFYIKRKSLEFRLKIDSKSFSEADDIGKLRLIFDVLMQSIEFMPDFKIPQDKINMLKEVCQAAEEKAIFYISPHASLR